MAAGPRTVVVGQVGRDLVLHVEALPDAGAATEVLHRFEALGGKGANQAVAAAQLGASVALLGVVGDDDAGSAVLAQAVRDGIDASAVVRRPDCRTALLVDVVEDDGTRRLLEHVPAGVLLTAEDVRGASGTVAGADVVLLQLQQPADAVHAALDACAPDALVVADGGTDDPDLRAALVARAQVVRADTAEAQALTGRILSGVPEVAAAARDLLDAGPRVVALAAGPDGDVVAWAGGCVVVPLLDVDPAVVGPLSTEERPRTGVAEPTGAGDSFVAALAVAVARGAPPEEAARMACAAAALTAARAGGRPVLDPDVVRSVAAAVAVRSC